MYQAGVCDLSVFPRNGCITSWKGVCVREPCVWRLWKQHVLNILILPLTVCVKAAIA